MEKKKAKKKINTTLLFILIVLSYILIFFIGKIIIVPYSNIIKHDKNEIISNNIINEEDAIINNNINSSNVSNSNIVEQNKTGLNNISVDNNTIGIDQNITNPDIEPKPVKIKITENGNKPWDQLEYLDIFKNSYFYNTNIIAPGVSGKYNFEVESTSNKSIIYFIKFIEDNPKRINIKYKLKKDNEYIIGNENEWSYINNESTNNFILQSKDTQKYTLYWYWEHSKNDTDIGMSSDSKYGLQIKISSSVVEE